MVRGECLCVGECVCVCASVQFVVDQVPLDLEVWNSA